MNAYYNEIEPYPAQWMCNLIAAGHIADGRVDVRSIADVHPEDIAATQAHFFAGIGIWSAALRAAGWLDDCEVWTGSCPCQPFSTAGKGKGTDDERHLWPEWYRLITACRPPIIFGEQVSSKDALAWLDIVSADLERIGYTVRAISANACGVGAPHQRQRLYFAAHTDSERFERIRLQLRKRGSLAPGVEATRSSETVDMADSNITRLEGRYERRDGADQRAARACGMASSVGHTHSERVWRDPGAGNSEESRCTFGRFNARVVSDSLIPSGSTGGHWSNARWIQCTDGKARAIEPGTFPLADGHPSRVAELRAYGNAIVKPHAQAFVESVIECLV